MTARDVRFMASPGGKGWQVLAVIGGRDPIKLGQTIHSGTDAIAAYDFLINGGFGDICHLIDDLREPVKPTVEPEPRESMFSLAEIAWARSIRATFDEYASCGEKPEVDAGLTLVRVNALLQWADRLLKAMDDDRVLLFFTKAAADEFEELAAERIAAREKSEAAPVDDGGLTADEIAWVRGHRELFLAREDEGAAPVFATDEDTGSICALLAGFNEMKRRGANFFCTQPDRSLVLAELIDERIAAREKAAADAAKLAEPESKRTLSQITLDLLSRLREGNDVVIPRVWPGKSYHDTRMISSLLRGRWLMEDGSPDKVIDNFAGKPEPESINEFAPLGSHDDCDENRRLKAENRELRDIIISSDDDYRHLVEENRELRSVVKTPTKAIDGLDLGDQPIRTRPAAWQGFPVADAATDDDDREDAIARHAQSPV